MVIVITFRTLNIICLLARIPCNYFFIFSGILFIASTGGWRVITQLPLCAGFLLCSPSLLPAKMGSWFSQFTQNAGQRTRPLCSHTSLLIMSSNDLLNSFLCAKYHQNNMLIFFPLGDESRQCNFLALSTYLFVCKQWENTNNVPLHFEAAILC